MKVKAIISFNDLENNTHRNIGDVFEVSEERANFLLDHKAIEIIEEPKEETIEETVEVEETVEEKPKSVKHKKNKKK